MWMLLTPFKKLYERRLNLDEYAVQLDKDVEKSRALLEKLVENALIEWSIYHIRSENESYMTDEKRNKCMEWVIKRVIENSSPAVIAHVGIGYPAATTEEYINSVKNIAMMHVMNFCIRQNTKDMSDNIPNVNIADRI